MIKQLTQVHLKTAVKMEYCSLLNRNSLIRHQMESDLVPRRERNCNKCLLVLHENMQATNTW